MNYKETLFFIGKCLTINHEKSNKILVEKQLKLGTVDWDNVVRVSTAQYVFPALYCNLKRADFLHYLPNDLVDYMQHITNLNRERNEQIIEQAKEINKILLENSITPIFLKGTAFLLEGLYEDIAERMVGDIDFLVNFKSYHQAYEVLISNGYSQVHKAAYYFPSFKHLPRIQHPDKIGAIEVHKEMLKEEYADEFNYKTIINNVIHQDSFHFLSFSDQLSLAIIANQINDDEQFQYRASLRNMYDVFLLSKKVNSLKSIKKYNKLFDPLNNFLAVSKVILNSEMIHFTKNKNSDFFTKKFLDFLLDREEASVFNKKTGNKIFLNRRLSLIKKAFINKENRIWLIKRITDRKWLNAKYKQLFSKSNS